LRRVPEEVFYGLVVAAVLALIALGVQLITGGSDRNTASNGYPVIRGRGTDSLRLRGEFEGTSFVARSALVFANESGLVLQIFPEVYDCAAWHARIGKKTGYEVAITLDDNPTAAATLPIGERLPPYEDGQRAAFTTGSGNGFDILGGFANVTLTRIDTSAGGVWRGRIKAGSGFGGSFSLQGTFAAKWCA